MGGKILTHHYHYHYHLLSETVLERLISFATTTFTVERVTLLWYLNVTNASIKCLTLSIQ